MINGYDVFSFVAFGVFGCAYLIAKQQFQLMFQAAINTTFHYHEQFWKDTCVFNPAAVQSCIQYSIFFAMYDKDEGRKKSKQTPHV